MPQNFRDLYVIAIFKKITADGDCSHEIKDACSLQGKEKKRKGKLLSRVRLFVTPWTVAYQAALSMGFSRQEYWSGLPFPSPGDLPSPRIEPRSPMLQADSLPSEPPGKPSNRTDSSHFVYPFVS